MPIAFIFVGALLVLTSFKDTYSQLGAQLQKDFTGTGNFFVWAFAVLLIGALGYVEKLRGFSHAFLALLLLSMFLSNSQRGDILTSMKEGLLNPVTPEAPPAPEKKADAGTSGGASTGQADLTKPASALSNADISKAFSGFMQPNAALGTSMGGLFGGGASSGGGGGNPLAAIGGMFGGGGGNPLDMLGGLMGGGGGGSPLDMVSGVFGGAASGGKSDGNDWTKGVMTAAKMLFMFI
jgi:hypothetical protein